MFTLTAVTIPEETLAWLGQPSNPAVAFFARTTLLGEEMSPELEALWARRNEYRPVATILDAMRDDGSWLPPERDYKKYEGNLWQIHFLGELWANGDDARVQRAAEYAFSRQLGDGSWSCNGRPSASISCLTANVGRALARMGYAEDDRVVAALRSIVDLHRDLGYIGCRGVDDFTLNGYCHMVTPKILLLLGEVPRESWPRGAVRLRDACVRALRDKEIYRALPEKYRLYYDEVLTLPKADVPAARKRFLKDHTPLHYRDKKGWMRLGYPLSYNSDVLDSLHALASVGETMRPQYAAAVDVVRAAADNDMRWMLANTFTGKMLADVETKGSPSKWLTLRALQALNHFGG